MEQQDLISGQVSEIEQIQREGYEAGIRKARNALYWAGGLVFLAEMIGMYKGFGGFNATVLIIAVVEAAIFILLALYTKKKPYTAIIIGLCFFIFLIVASVAITTYNEGATGFMSAIAGGILIRIIILVNLIRPLKDAKELQSIIENEKYNLQG